MKVAHGILKGLCAGLGPGALCIDCGTHYGKITTTLAATGTHVHAFEPDPHNWQHLQTVCSTMKNVALHNAAVAAQRYRQSPTGIESRFELGLT